MPVASIAVPIALAILKVAAVALAGFLLARRGILHETALGDLSSLVIKVAVPCLIFANAAAGFAGFSLQSALLVVLGAPVVLVLGLLGGLLLGRALRVERSHWRAVICAATFQNANYLPIAVATAVLPPLAMLFPQGSAPAAAIAGAGIIYISLFGVLYSPLFWGIGLWWLQEEPGTVHPLSIEFWTRRLPPPIFGIALGYLFGLTPLHRALTPPAAPLHFLFLAIKDIGDLAVPLANLILGGMLAQAVAGRALQSRDVTAVALTKLVIVPGVGLAALWLTRQGWAHHATLALAAFVLFLEMTSPPATNLAVMSKSGFKGVPNAAAGVVPGLLLVTYLLSMVTMPLWLLLFFHVIR